MPVNWFPGTVEDFANQLANDIAAGNAVLLVGAGVSSVSPSRLPLGRELRDTVIQLVSSNSKLRMQYKQLEKNSKYETLLPEIAFSDLFTVLQSKLLLAFGVLRQSTPNLIHDLISYFSRQYRLPVFTTNFDNLLEIARADQSLVFHLHGSLARPETMAILLRHVHQRARPLYYEEFLERLKSRNLYVFGYSGADPDIMKLVSDAACHKVYWLIRSEPSKFTHINVDQVAQPVIAFGGDLETLFASVRKKFIDFCPDIFTDASEGYSNADVRRFRASISLGERYLALALLLYRIHEFHASVELCRRGLQEQVAANRKEQLQLVIFLAEVSNVIGEPKESVLPFLETEAERAADIIFFGQLLNTIGLLYLREDDFAVARGYFQRARDVSRRRIASRREDEVPLARTVLSQTENNIGLCYYGEGKLEFARKCFLRSLRLKRKIGHVLGEVASMHNLALVALRGGQDKSFSYWERIALRTAEKYRLWRRIVEYYRDTSDIFTQRGNDREARKRLNRAILICKQQIAGMDRELNDLQERLVKLSN